MVVKLNGVDSNTDVLNPLYLRLIKMLFQFVPHRKRGPAVTYLVEALCYKPEGRGFEFR
jgi:hypothetical protein